MAMEEKEAEEEEEGSEFRTQTRRTTENIQIETGVRIAMSSSPNDSRMLLGLWFRSIFLATQRFQFSQVKFDDEASRIRRSKRESLFSDFSLFLILSSFKSLPNTTSFIASFTRLYKVSWI